jgi:hypothetical protein
MTKEPKMSLRISSTLVVLAVASALSASSLAARARPIIDTHIHVYQVTRPGGGGGGAGGPPLRF